MFYDNVGAPIGGAAFHSSAAEISHDILIFYNDWIYGVFFFFFHPLLVHWDATNLPHNLVLLGAKVKLEDYAKPVLQDVKNRNVALPQPLRPAAPDYEADWWHPNEPVKGGRRRRRRRRSSRYRRSIYHGKSRRRRSGRRRRRSARRRYRKTRKRFKRF